MANWNYVWADDVGAYVVTHWTGTQWEYVASFETENEVFEFFNSIGVHSELLDIL